MDGVKVHSLREQRNDGGGCIALGSRGMTVKVHSLREQRNDGEGA